MKQNIKRRVSLLLLPVPPAGVSADGEGQEAVLLVLHPAPAPAVRGIVRRRKKTP